MMKTARQDSFVTPPRWRAIVADPDARSRSIIAHAIERAGGRVEGEVAECRAALAPIERLRPDVAILAPPRPEDLVLRSPGGIAAVPCCPIVLLTREVTPVLLEKAREAGVMALLLKPLRAAQLAATLDLAVARFADAERLRRALADRKVIERAKGQLMARHRITEDEAYHRLRRRAMDARVSLIDVARAVLATETTEDRGRAPAPTHASSLHRPVARHLDVATPLRHIERPARS